MRLRARSLLAMSLAALGLVPAIAAAGRGGRLGRVEAPTATRRWVPAGGFVMGTSPDDLETLYDECRRAESLTAATQQSIQPQRPCDAWARTLADRPPRDVWLDGFWVDRREVTVAEYRRCVYAGGCPLAPLVDGDPLMLDDQLPQVDVERGEAEQFCGWRGGRLPTEAEWEKAARGTDLRTWPWGDDRRQGAFNHGQFRIAAYLDLEHVRDPDNDIRYQGDPDPSDGFPFVAPPGRFPAGDSAYGVSDLAGNVAEWVADAFVIEGFQGLPSLNPLRAPLPGREAAMVRGGSWRDPPFLGRVDLPHYLSLYLQPTTRRHDIGFRCVYGPPGPPATPPPAVRNPSP